MSDITAYVQGNVSDEGQMNWRSGDSAISPGDQSMYNTSTVQLSTVGDIKVVGDRIFRYSRAGGAINAGECAQLPSGALINVTAGNADPAGGKSLTFYFATAVSANQYAEAYVYCQSGTAANLGFAYKVKSHLAVATTSTGVLTLYEPLYISPNTADSWSLVPNPYRLVTQNTAGTGFCPGVSPITVTSNDYFWLQTGGPAAVKASGGAIGAPMTPGNTGAAGPVIVTTANATASLTTQIIGYSMITQTASQKGLVFLEINT